MSRQLSVPRSCTQFGAITWKPPRSDPRPRLTAASYPANLAPPWNRYPTAVGPKPVKRPFVPSAATIFLPATRSELPFNAGSIWIRVLTTSIAAYQLLSQSAGASRYGSHIRVMPPCELWASATSAIGRYEQAHMVQHSAPAAKKIE